MNSLRAFALVLLAALTGCSSLPAVRPDMTPVDRNGIRFQAANGRILSPERNRSLVAALAAGDQADSLAGHLALEQAVSETPLTLGNRVVLLENGPATYAEMFRLIAGARDHINMETYILEEDEVGERFAAALVEKQSEGVQVNLIRDGIGTLGVSQAFWKRLTDAGVQVLEFNPGNPLAARSAWDLNQRDHRKLLIADGRSAILGGINISGVYASGSANARLGSGTPRGGGPAPLPWRDTNLLVEGPVLATLQQLFVETWESQKGPPLAPKDHYPVLDPVGREVVRAIGSTPQEPFSHIYVTLISALNSADAQILLTNAYFVPDRSSSSRWFGRWLVASTCRSSCPAPPTPRSCSMPAGPTSSRCCVPV